MNPQDNSDTTRARQGFAQGRMRYVLAFSLAAAILSMGVVWMVIR